MKFEDDGISPINDPEDEFEDPWADFVKTPDGKIEEKMPEAQWCTHDPSSDEWVEVEQEVYKNPT